MDDRKRKFYESLKGREYTITTLVSLHEVTRLTATKWLKQAGITPIEYTWPPKYTLPDEYNIAEPNASPTSKQTAPKQTREMLEGYLKHLLDTETEVDIAKLFRDVKDINDIRRVVKGLEDTLAVANFYSQFFTEDGLI